VEHLKKAKHTVRDGCDSVGFIFTAASKAVAEIQNIHEITSQKAEVEYTWKWMLDPSGVELVDHLTQPDLIEVNANLQEVELHRRPNPTFNLADMVQSATPRPGKAMLKKSGDGWILDD
jgi:phosphoribosylanthranilate isomerase